jgi:hypothetical protein
LAKNPDPAAAGKKLYIMATSIYVLIITALVLTPIVVIYLLDRKEKTRETRVLLQHFHKTASIHQLAISSQDVLRHGIIGLDGQHRTLLFVEQMDVFLLPPVLIHLDEVRSCMLVKNLHVGEENSFSPDKTGRAREIYLHLDLYDRSPVQFLFYRQGENSRRSRLRLETKAAQWQALLSKLIVPAEPMKKRG